MKKGFNGEEAWGSCASRPRLLLEDAFLQDAAIDIVLSAYKGCFTYGLDADDPIGGVFDEAVDGRSEKVNEGDGARPCNDADSLMGTSQTQFENRGGMKLNRGYVSPYMATDTDTMEAVLVKPYILLTDLAISNIQEIVPLLESIRQEGAPLLIVAKDVTDEALATLLFKQNTRHIKCGRY